jgi:hypothetical protein
MQRVSTLDSPEALGISGLLKGCEEKGVKVFWHGEYEGTAWRMSEDFLRVARRAKAERVKAVQVKVEETAGEAVKGEE